jgi:DNA-binding Lrp family transcriptional regulator
VFSGEILFMARPLDVSPPQKDKAKANSLELSQLNIVEKKLIGLLSADLSLSPKPYAALADELGISEAEAIAAVSDLLDKGLIRRLGAVLAHQKSGFSANALIVWLLDESRLDRVGELFAGLPYVSHCYRRLPVSGWPYNLYTMVHALDRERLLAMVQNMAEMADPKEWRFLESLKEFKKESLRLFF